MAKDQIDEAKAEDTGGRQSSTKCIYFADQQDIDSFESHLSPFPKASTSNIIQQLVRGFNKTMAQRKEQDSRKVTVQIEIWL